MKETVNIAFKNINTLINHVKKYFLTLPVLNRQQSENASLSDKNGGHAFIALPRHPSHTLSHSLGVSFFLKKKVEGCGGGGGLLHLSWAENGSIWTLMRARICQTNQKKKLGTWDQTLNEESFLPFTVFGVSSLPGDVCRAAHIGDLSQQHRLVSPACQSLFCESVQALKCEDVSGSFVFFCQGSHGPLSAVAPASLGTSRSLGAELWRSRWRRRGSYQEEEQTITIQLHNTKQQM